MPLRASVALFAREYKDTLAGACRELLQPANVSDEAKPDHVAEVIRVEVHEIGVDAVNFAAICAI
jgi:hypothetical protein